MHLIKKVMINGGIFGLALILTYQFIFSKMDFKTVAGALGQARLPYIFLGMLMTSCAIGLEGLVTKRNLSLVGVKTSWTRGLSYALAGNFFSAITPAASGGQPAVIVLMKKDKVTIDQGSLALLMDLVAYQISIVTFGLVAYLVYFKTINQSLGQTLPLLWIGLLLNGLLLLTTLSALFSESFFGSLVKGVLVITGIFSKKQVDKIIEKAEAFKGHHRACKAVILKDKLSYLANIGMTAIRILLIFSAPFMVYKSLGLDQVHMMRLLSLQAALYISCAALPFPGTIGIGEANFLLFFSSIFSSGLISSAMILSRSISLYTTLVVSGLGMLFIWVNLNLRSRREKKLSY